MGVHGPAWLPDIPGTIICLLGVIAQYYVLRAFGVSKRLSAWLSASVFVVGLVLGFVAMGHGPKSTLRKHFEDLTGASQLIWSLFCIGTALLLCIFKLLPRRKAQVDAGRRGFLKTSTAAACVIPAAVLGAAVITRKDFHVQEIDIAFPQLPADLNGLRLLQISDIHMGTFFSRTDLARVVDACNNLRPELGFITGDLITDQYDPLDDCLQELRRLKATSGVFGCMGNHEMYARCQRYTKRVAQEMGMDFLRYESRLLRFGTSKLNLMGVDYQRSGMHLPSVGEMRREDAFNLLLSHTPAIFPDAIADRVDLTLSGHTHGGQINLPVAGMNINLVDLVTPYTKGLYRQDHSAVYVNSGLGTIGIPMRIGAPPEITVIRLCNS